MEDQETRDDQDVEVKTFKIPQRYTRSGRKRAVSFPLKLMKVLSIQTKQYQEIISWTPSGKAFRVKDSKRFVAEIFPVHFNKRGAKFSSFTRKLHRWGFQRHYRGGEAGSFYHKYFIKDQVDLVEKMSCSPSSIASMACPNDATYKVPMEDDEEDDLSETPRQGKTKKALPKEAEDVVGMKEEVDQSFTRMPRSSSLPVSRPSTSMDVSGSSARAAADQQVLSEASAGIPEAAAYDSTIATAEAIEREVARRVQERLQAAALQDKILEERAQAAATMQRLLDLERERILEQERQRQLFEQQRQRQLFQANIHSMVDPGQHLLMLASSRVPNLAAVSVDGGLALQQHLQQRIEQERQLRVLELLQMSYQGSHGKSNPGQSNSSPPNLPDTNSPNIEGAKTA